MNTESAHCQQRVSIVLPTYNRGPKLAATLDHLLASEVEGLEEVEIIVVDDGSPISAASLVGSKAVPSPFSLRLLRQDNAGPAAARNTGFRVSRGEIVIFIDDDILCPPQLIRQHVAAHSLNPRAVIFGRCPFVEPLEQTSLFRFVDTLGHDVGARATEEFLRTPIIASGNLSVERDLFEPDEGVYRDDLATPAAEEYELSQRLSSRGILILLATNLVARHDHPVELDGMCRQAYKHALGCAEAVRKCRGSAQLAEVCGMIQANGLLSISDGNSVRIKKIVKRLLSVPIVRNGLLRATQGAERFVPCERFLFPMYRALLGLYLFAGIREGLRKFADCEEDVPNYETVSENNTLSCG